MSKQLAAALEAIAPGISVTDPDVIASFTSDWTGRFRGQAQIVARPKSRADVIAVVTACAANGYRIQIQGGNTGLVGGSVPEVDAEAVCLLSTADIKYFSNFDEISGHITVGAGVTLKELQDFVRPRGWDFAVDLAARESATVGGLIATNAGGVRVCAFGMTKRSVAGVEVVLADGRIMSNLEAPLKDNTGYAVEDLAIGSEGTLGVVTAVRLKLIRPIEESTLLVIPTESLGAAHEILAAIQKSGAQLLAAEYLDTTSMNVVLDRSKLRPLWSEIPAVTLLLEIAGSEVTIELPENTLGSTDKSEQRTFWKYRESASDSWTATGNVHKLDVSVAVNEIADFESALRDLLDANPDVKLWGSFGHLADGNLHIEIVGPAPLDFSVDKAVLELVVAFNGSVSAEHGIGRAKAEYLAMTRPAIDIEISKKIKNMFDPSGMFNPGVLYVD